MAGGNLQLLRTGDRVRVDLNKRTVNALVPEEEWEKRKKEPRPEPPESQTPWQEIYRQTVGQLDTGACMELAVKYQRVREAVPRHSH
jgi:dihydroxy-acid dehydratase